MIIIISRAVCKKVKDSKNEKKQGPKQYAPHGEMSDIPKCAQAVRFVLWSTYKEKRKERMEGREGEKKRGDMWISHS